MFRTGRVPGSIAPCPYQPVPVTDGITLCDDEMGLWVIGSTLASGERRRRRAAATDGSGLSGQASPRVLEKRDQPLTAFTLSTALREPRNRACSWDRLPSIVSQQPASALDR